MCIPTDSESILALLQQMQELGFQATLLRDEPVTCKLCTPQQKCWFCKSWQERRAQ